VSDLVIVVPGIMGSVLKRGNRVVWDTSVVTAARGILDFQNTIRALALPEGLGDSAPDAAHTLEPSGLLRGWHLMPGAGSGRGYLGMVKELRRLGAEPLRVAEFAYDWRLSNRYTARRLKRFTESALEQWQDTRRDPDARVVFVCHSMGGLVARHYVNQLGGHELCRRIVTIGTPYSGSVNAIRTLTGGSRMPDRLVAAARTMPALHQLLPSFACVRTSQGPATLAVSPLPGIEAGMAADAAALHAQGHTAHGTPLHVFAGWRHNTRAGIALTPDGFDYRWTWPETGAQGTVAERDLSGDGTVPRFAAIPPEWSDDTDVAYRPVRHSEQPEDLDLVQSVWAKIENLNPRTFMDTDTDLGVDIPDYVPLNEPVLIRARAAAPDLKVITTATSLRSPKDTQTAAADPDGNGGYLARLLLGPGVWHVAVRVVGQPSASGDLVLVG
jgi:pimeloyl-ACP methyl ester carboxylesterase